MKPDWESADGRITLYLGDCLEVMPHLEDTVDAIICDLPYGTTQCAWDTVIPFTALWASYKRLLKNNGAVVLFGSQPFTSALVMSNREWFKYEWIWEKGKPTGFVHAKNKPLKAHENIQVFSSGTTVHESQSVRRMPYFPQGLISKRSVKNRSVGDSTDTCFAARPGHVASYIQTDGNYPRSILRFDNDYLGIHETAKPVALIEYLIRTYTNPGELVLDNTFGSGTAAIACINTGRRFVGIERDPAYFAKAVGRIEAHIKNRIVSLFDAEPEPVPVSLVKQDTFSFEG